MRKNLLIYVVGVMTSILTTLAQANTNTATTKATATLSSLCVISTQNINFGQISLPVSTQSASSNMTVQCTKGSSYTIGLAYGGIYGQGSSVQTQTGTQTISNCSHYFGGNCDQWDTTYVPVYTTTTSYYTYGKMTGSTSGDSIGYSIQVPNNPNQIWNTGNNSYSSTATGINQTIPVIATLIPGQTTNQYPEADNYLDTVTATITY